MSSTTEVEASNYGYINDVDLVAPSEQEGEYLNVYSGAYETPPGNNRYEGLDDSTKEISHKEKEQEQKTSAILEMEGADHGAKTDRHCRRPPIWGWTVIGIGTAVLGVLIGFLIVYSQKTCQGETDRITQQPGDCSMISLMHTRVSLPQSAIGVTVTVECVTGATLSGGWNKYVTICDNGTWTETASCAFVDCLGAYNNGYRTSGVFRISPDGLRQMDVYCEQEEDLGGWTVIQRRLDGYLSFYHDWKAYKTGFGNVSGEFWLGNDNIHALTASRGQTLKVEMVHPNTTFARVRYSEFWIDDEPRMHVSGFWNNTPPGDALTYHNGSIFTTIDQDNDMDSLFNCARVHVGAWWYKDCMYSNLNGLYKADSHQGLRWHPFTQYAESLTKVKMMVKTN